MEIQTKFISDDHMSGIDYIILPPMSLASAEVMAQKLGMEEERIYSDYDCTGKRFAHKPHIRVTRTRTLITQYWGIDI